MGEHIRMTKNGLMTEDGVAAQAILDEARGGHTDPLPTSESPSVESAKAAYNEAKAAASAELDETLASGSVV